MSEKYIATCRHCGKQITWSGTFGWYHGVKGAGWNTTCNDGDAETRAEVNDEWAHQAQIDLYDMGVPYPKVLHTGVAVREEAEESTVSDEAKEKLAALFRIWSRKDESWEGVYDDHESALEIVDRIIKAGWRPAEETSGLEKLKEANALFDTEEDFHG